MSCGIVLSSLLSLSSLIVPGLYCLIFLRYRGWGRWELLCNCCCSGKTCVLCCCSSSSEYFGCRNRILPPLFIGFNSNTLSNSLLLPLLYKSILFQLSIDRVRSHSPSNTPNIEFPILVFCVSILLPLHILLLY